MFPLRPAKAGTRPGILILLSGDIETNPGPTYICSLCNNRINNRQISILCNSNSPHWVHKSCTNITLNHYRQTNGTWTCTLHPANTSAAPHPNPNTNSPIAPQIPAPPHGISNRTVSRGASLAVTVGHSTTNTKQK